LWFDVKLERYSTAYGTRDCRTGCGLVGCGVSGWHGKLGEVIL